MQSKTDEVPKFIGNKLYEFHRIFFVSQSTLCDARDIIRNNSEKSWQKENYY